MSNKPAKSVSKKKNLYRLKLPASSENLDIVRKFISGIAANMGFTEEDIYQIELAVDEACTNVIKHAYNDNENVEKIINVTVHEKRDRIVITIADKGHGFDPGVLEPPDMKKFLKSGKRGGLGVHLIKTLMDEVTFNIKPGVRNEVKMVKILSA